MCSYISVDSVTYCFIAPCTDSGDVRLVGGTSNCNGVLEMQYQGKWRRVLAWFAWNWMSSSVVCRQLHCGSAVSTEFTSTSTHTRGWMIPSSCVGSEASLAECGAVKSHDGNVTLKVTCSGTAMTSTMTVFCDLPYRLSTQTERSAVTLGIYDKTKCIVLNKNIQCTNT